MAKPLSAQLADLSVRVKEAEAAAAAAHKEARDKLLARRAQAQADATAAIQKMDRDIKAASDKSRCKLECFKGESRRRYGRLECQNCSVQA